MNNIIDKLIYVPENNIIRRSTFWNMISSLLNACTSSILLMIVTRACGVDVAGQFSIATAYAYQCISLGNFGTRNFQVSDVNKDYSFADYFYFRIFSSVIMYGMLLYYSFLSGYTFDKALIILSYGLFKCLDVIEDLYHGEYQRNQRLDIGAILLSMRYIISLVIFFILILITKNAVISCFLVALVSFVLFLIPNKILITRFFDGKYIFNKEKQLLLFKMLLPIMLCNYFRTYVTNMPKYVVDDYLGDTIQVYYSVLVLPTSIIGLLSDIIFRPYIFQLSYAWVNKDRKKFKHLVLKQLLVIVFFTIVIVVGGVVLGLTLLELLYDVQLHNYMNMFVILLISGGLTTVSGLLILLLTIMRKQKWTLYGYLITLCFGLIVRKYLITNYELLGATLLYFIQSLIPVLFFSGIAVCYYKRG